MDYKQILEQQLATDYDCSIAEVQGTENIFRIYKENENARPVGEEGCGFKLACVNEKLLVMAEAPLLEWCKEKLANVRGTWMSEPANLIRLHEKLKEYGQSLADAHHYYIPAENAKKPEHRFDVRWYEKEEIKRFEGDERFDEALLFDEETPDMLAVCAMKGETILGMAGATADTPMIWQIGVNVTEEGKGLGVGTYVTALLKQRVLEAGKMPIYSTVESHIKSQKVALAAGFVPAFYEIFSKKES
ncbi:MAG: GNAT family N-acetyltransferase [Clostridiales bacterium]|nr:GNAT family N-acetyltransferase [Roseburia sp.]MDD7635749.1 GNAT family N-acetyltransferase [Clostridiales bacterium]MDY4112276.1 GNAT family N-acetyltransferase [Roseburia sp.]